ncbi:MAG: lysophospholipid acyltransferase family protein [Desulfovibrionaceae bacterium]
MNTALMPYDNPFGDESLYHSPPHALGWCTRQFPSFMFYLRMFSPVARLCHLAKFGKADNYAWVRSSSDVLRALERAGCVFHAEGLENINTVEGPCIFAANHMSTLETFVLPCIIQPRRNVTFVVKRSLTTMPLFGPVMRSRDPIILDRKNARQDLVTVLEEGEKRLQRGISIIIFPQSTRSNTFNPAKFNSIATKLAKRTGIPIIPLALQTAAWGQGKIMKDFGSIYPDKPVNFRFGAPIQVEGAGKVEHLRVCDFIQATLEEWKNTNAHR